MKSYLMLDARLLKTNQRLWFAWAVTVLFLVLAGGAASRHEFWRDEMQAWLIARDTPGVAAMLEQAHYEGAPPLWHLMLRPLALVTHRPEAVQALTWVLGGATVFLLCFYAPFNRLQKTLFVGNYYLLYQYGTVCRNYLPGLLLLTVACILVTADRVRPWAIAVALSGAALASVHTLIVAVAIAAAFWGSHAFDTLRAEKEPGARTRCLHLLPLMGFIVGLCFSVYAMFPRVDTLYGPAHGWRLGWNPERLSKIACAFVSAFFPLPRPGGFFWIPPWDTPFPSYDPQVVSLLAFALFAVGLWVLSGHARSLLLFLFGALGLGGFFYIKFLGNFRHTGLWFFVFLFAFWLKRARTPERVRGGSRWAFRGGELVLTAALATQAVTGLWAVREDWSRPFSCGKEAAQLLKVHHLEEAFIAVGPDWAGAPLAGYLERILYYPHADRYGSYTEWNTRRADVLSDGVFLERAIGAAGGRTMVVALDHALAPELLVRFGGEGFAEVRGSLTPFEEYHLFLFPAKAAVVEPSKDP